MLLMATLDNPNSTLHTPPTKDTTHTTNSTIIVVPYWSTLYSRVTYTSFMGYVCLFFQTINKVCLTHTIYHSLNNYANTVIVHLTSLQKNTNQTTYASICPTKILMHTPSSPSQFPSYHIPHKPTQPTSPHICYP